MLDIKFLENSGYFKKVILERGDTLFDEGDINNNLYIVIVGELLVKKYTTIKKDETKILAKLKKDDIFGEAALNSDKPKDVKIIASKKTYILSIDAKKGLDSFNKKYPEEGNKLLKYIIFLSNKRLSESNYLITANFKVSNEIMNLDNISNKAIFKVIDKLKNIVAVDYILYFEKNPVMDNYLILKYDSRISGKLQDKIIEITNNKLDLLNFKIEDNNYFSQKLIIGKKSFGYLYFFRKGILFTENDKKVLASVGTSIAGLIKDKQLIDEQNNIDFMEE